MWDIMTIKEGVSGILALKTILESIPTYLKMIESLDVKIDRFIKNKFDTAVRELQDAQNMKKSNKKKHIEIARSLFNEAVGLEKGERLMFAYLGLAVCDKYLGNKENFIIDLNRALYISPDNKFWEQCIVKGASLLRGIGWFTTIAIAPVGLLPILAPINAIADDKIEEIEDRYYNKKNRIANMQADIRNYIAWEQKRRERRIHIRSVMVKLFWMFFILFLLLLICYWTGILFD